MTTRSKMKMIGMPAVIPSEQSVKRNWETIKTAIILIQERRGRGLSFQELYKLGYNLVIGQQIDFLYRNLTEVIKSHLLLVHNRLKSTEASAILPAVLEAFRAHTSAMIEVRDILHVMDSRRSSSRLSVYDLGLALFVSEVLCKPPLDARILEGALALIDGSRSGDTVNRQPLRELTSMLTEAGAATEEGAAAVYERVFNVGFLKHTRDVYRSLAQKNQQEMDPFTYLRWVSATLEQEQSLAEYSMDGALTTPPLLAQLRGELLETYKAEIVAAADVRGMIEGGRADNLALLLRLFKHVSGGLKMVGDRVREYIDQACEAAVGSVGDDVDADGAGAAGAAAAGGSSSGGGSGGGSSGGSKGAIKLVGVFCELIGKFYSLLATELDGDTEFTHTLNTAFGAVINKHERISEYLSIYIDHAIRNHLKDQSVGDLDKTFDRAIRLFRLLREKDVFERYYKQHLARRLLLVRSTSDEAERMVISRLKAECGNQFTNRFEQMFKDMQVSDANMKLFREQAEAKEGGLGGVIGKMDLDVRVLTTVMWPTQQAVVCKLPPQLMRATAAFQEWYIKTYTGRKITWQTSLGSMTVQARFPKGGKLLSVSTLQGLLLLLFNDADGEALPVSEIEERTGLPLAQIGRALLSLSVGKHRVLTKSSDSTKEVVAGDSFAVNLDFSSKMTKIKIAQAVAKETVQERQVTQARVDEDRRLLTEACIVRVMKARKTLGHNDLVIEVTKMLSSRFTPTPQQIKKRIERLIDADYLKRSATEASVYEYIS